MTPDITPEEFRELVRHGTSGHLYDWLPGNDHKAAISYVTSTHHGWGGPSQRFWGQVQRKGVGYWSSISDAQRANPANAAFFLPWSKVLDIVDKGTSPDRRAAYEDAYTRWCQWHHANPYVSYRAALAEARRQPVNLDKEEHLTDLIHSTARAITDAGVDLEMGLLQAEPLQPSLF